MPTSVVIERMSQRSFADGGCSWVSVDAAPCTFALRESGTQSSSMQPACSAHRALWWTETPPHVRTYIRSPEIFRFQPFRKLHTSFDLSPSHLKFSFRITWGCAQTKLGIWFYVFYTFWISHSPKMLLFTLMAV